jgi:acyl dehydratase
VIDYDNLKSWVFDEIRQQYRVRDTLLYALSLGLGAGFADDSDLHLVYERNLQALPTMATVLGSPGFWWRDPRTAADFLRIVHGEQHVRIFSSLPAEGTIVARNRVASVSDKGAGRGAVVSVDRQIFAQPGGELLCETRSINFLRGDGGFSAADGRSDAAPSALPFVPQTGPDHEVRLSTFGQQALLYRLNGDHNPIHADPVAAREAGFVRPILHGLCTFGMSAVAILKARCHFDARRLTSLSVRFTAPVFPGETLKFQLWNATQRSLHLRAIVEERNCVVLNNGWAELT